MKDCIVTGATSMVGSAIVREALSQGRNVAAIVRKNSKQNNNLKRMAGHQNLKIVECEIHDYANLHFEETYDAFFHIAWQGSDVNSRDDAYTHIDNIKYTIDAVYAAHRAGCRVFVDAGSQAEYGRATEKLGGCTPCNPESGYGTAKYAAGKMAYLTASQLGIRSCHTRILSTYGEGMSDGTVIIYLIKTLLAGEKPLLTKCEQLWDYMYVQDTARALLDIAEKGVSGRTYPIGTGAARPLREYFEVIRDIINPSLELGFGEKDYYPHQPMYLCADIGELQQDTGFIPAVGFEEGIKKTIDWVNIQAKEQ